MSTHMARGGEVLRGMFVEATPVRIVGRPRAATIIEPAISELELLEQARRAGHEEGVRLGRAEGLQAGYEEGLEKGRADAAVQAEVALKKAIAAMELSVQGQEAQLRDMLRALTTALDAGRAVAEDEMVALCFETICRVLGEVAVQPETVRLHLAKALSLVSAEQPAVLHVHPQDAALLDRAAAGPGPRQPARLVQWIPDTQVSMGGCIVHAGSGSLDVRLETTVETMRSALSAARARRAEMLGDGA